MVRGNGIRIEKCFVIHLIDTIDTRISVTGYFTDALVGRHQSRFTQYYSHGYSKSTGMRVIGTKSTARVRSVFDLRPD